MEMMLKMYSLGFQVSERSSRHFPITPSAVFEDINDYCLHNITLYNRNVLRTYRIWIEKKVHNIFQTNVSQTSF